MNNEQNDMVRIIKQQINEESQIFHDKFVFIKTEAYANFHHKVVDNKTKQANIKKSIQDSKKLLIEAIKFIFNHPYKDSQFIIKNEDSELIVKGSLGLFFKSFASAYNLNLEAISKRLYCQNQKKSILNNKMSLDEFMDAFDTHYYQVEYKEKLRNNVLKMAA